MYTYSELTRSEVQNMIAEYIRNRLTIHAECYDGDNIHVTLNLNGAMVSTTAVNIKKPDDGAYY